MENREKKPMLNFLSKKLEVKIKSDGTNKSLQQIDMGLLYQEVCNNLNPQIKLLALKKIRDHIVYENFCDKCVNQDFLRIIVKSLNFLNFEIQQMAMQIISYVVLRTKYVLKVQEVGEYILISKLSTVDLCQISLIALTNIASDAELKYTSELLNDLNDIVTNEFYSISTLRVCSQLICNMLSHGKISISDAQEIISIVKYLLQITDYFILPGSTTAVFLLSKMGCEYLDILLEHGLLKKLVDLLGHDYYGEQHIALNAIENFAASTTIDQNALLEENMLSHFSALLLNKNDDISEDATVIISCIVKEIEQKQAVIDAGLLHLVVENLNKGNKKLRLKSVSVITNMLKECSQDQKEFIFECYPLPGLCELLEYDYMNPIEEVLKCFLNILSDDEKTHDITLKIEEYGGVEKLKKLAKQNMENDVGILATSILQYFL